jgi:hypothetical protein
MKEALGLGHLSLKRLNTEGLWAGLLYCGPWKIRKASDKGISLHRGPFTSEGNLERGRGDSYTGDFE